MAIHNSGDISGVSRVPIQLDVELANINPETIESAKATRRATGIGSIDVDPAVVRQTISKQFGLDADVALTAEQAKVIAGLDAEAKAYLTAAAKGLSVNMGAASAGSLTTDVAKPWEGAVNSVVKQMGGAELDVNALVQWVLRESYMETSKDLYFYAEKVKFYNEVKKAIRDELSRAREAMVPYAGSEPESTISTFTGTKPQVEFTGSTEVQAGETVTVTTKAGLENYIKDLEEMLSACGDDAQLSNVDMQNVLQKQQQGMQMMSNISKMLHDTALAIIRKLG